MRKYMNISNGKINLYFSDNDEKMLNIALPFFHGHCLAGLCQCVSEWD